MRTTSVRKLLPEAWGEEVPASIHMWVRCNGADSDCSDWCGVAGFLCPVHTPDGTPCGLLNHLASACKVTAATLLLYMYMYIRYLQMQGADARNSAMYSSLEKNLTLGAAQCLLKKNSWCKYIYVRSVYITCMYMYTCTVRVKKNFP